MILQIHIPILSLQYLFNYWHIYLIKVAFILQDNNKGIEGCSDFINEYAVHNIFGVEMQEILYNQTKYSQIFSGEAYTLQGKCKDQTLFLKLIKQRGSNKKVYECEISYSNANPQLEKLFDQASDLLSYLKEKQNFKVDEQAGIITLLGKHPTKKSERVELHKIFLEERHEGQEDSLKKIIWVCGGKEATDQNFMRWAMKELAYKLEQMNQKISTQQNNRIIKKMQVIGDEIQNIKTKLGDLAVTNEQIQEKLKHDYEKYRVQLEQLKGQDLEIKTFFNDTLLRSQNKITKLYETLYEHNQTIKSLKDKLKMIVEDAKEPQSISMIKHEGSQDEKEVLARLDRTAKFFRHFVVRGINITKEDDFIFPTILVGAAFDERKQFTIKINKMGILKKIYPGVCVGIIDSRHRNKQSCDKSDNVIEFSCGGKLFEKNKYLRTQSIGFESGDAIKVKFSIEEKKITWHVNGNLRCTLVTDVIGQPGIQWRPYVFMRDKGDSIDWIL